MQVNNARHAASMSVKGVIHYNVMLVLDNLFSKYAWQSLRLESLP